MNFYCVIHCLHGEHHLVYGTDEPDAVSHVLQLQVTEVPAEYSVQRVCGVHDDWIEGEDVPECWMNEETVA